MSNEAKIFGGIAAATVLIVGFGAFFIGGNPKPDKPLPPADPKVLVRSDSHQLNAKNKKVTLVEFGDFQCPACGASHPVVTQLLAEDKGNMNFVFRNFPLPMHGNANVAAQAAEAAGDQGKYFEMHDLLYENQKEWSESKNALSDHFLGYAKQLKLDVDKFEKDVKDKKFSSKIDKDQADGNALGVNSTPTFFINGQLQAGGLPYDQFKLKIDEASKRK